MRQNKDILKGFRIVFFEESEHSMGTTYTYEDVLEAMKEAQKEIIDHILQKAADNVQTEDEYWEGLDDVQKVKVVNKQSILSLKDKIVEELNL